MADEDQIEETTEETEEPAEGEDAPEAPEGEPVVGGDGAVVEAVGSGSGAKGSWVYECSAGDYHSRDRADVEAHIAAIHGKAKAASKAPSKPRTAHKR